jgi:hypothetical protein
MDVGNVVGVKDPCESSVPSRGCFAGDCWTITRV